MGLVHPAAIVGLILNGGFLALLYALLPRFDEAQLTAEQLEQVGQMGEAYPFFLFLIFLQAASLFFVQRKSVLGLAGAVFGTIFMLPISIVYGLGAFLTYNNARFIDFAETGRQVDQARVSFRSSLTLPLLGAGAGCGVFAWFFFSSGVLDLGGLALAVAVILLYLAARSQRFPPLAIYDDCLVIVPQLLAKRITLPYNDLRVATLFQDKKIEFVLTGKNNMLRLNWSLKSIVGIEQKKALEQMAQVLREHGVVLL